MKLNLEKTRSTLKEQLNKMLLKMRHLQNHYWNMVAEKIIQPKIFSGLKIAIIAITAGFFIWFGPMIIQPALLFVNQPHYFHLKTDTTLLSNETEILNKQIKLLDNKLNTYIPKTSYLIINSTENKFFLYKGNALIREGRCSTGSYLQLEKGENQKWLFKTPKGEFKIRNKKTDPVWKKPDWAFVEEGMPIPSPNHPSRYEYGVLGDYALSLGDGYMIHGTIWQRYLGLPVTHGCVRLNDADLEVVYKALPIGSKVYIF